jgi:DNA-binding LytR/AlgR family response regulator
MQTIVTQIKVGGRKKVTPSEVILLVADANYTQIYFENGEKLLVATTLKKLQSCFEATNFFFRNHRSSIVNLRYIKEFDQTGIIMKNKQTLRISRRRLENLKEKMSGLI